MSLPTTVGLCPDPPCTAEFYMPDAKPGDRCPMHHGESDDAPLLVIYAPLAEIVEALSEYRDEDFAGIHVVHPAKYIERKFGGGERGPRCRYCNGTEGQDVCSDSPEGYPCTNFIFGGGER